MIGGGIELAILLALLVVWWRERSGLRAFARDLAPRSQDAAQPRRAAASHLPPALREQGLLLERGLRTPGNVDDVVRSALQGLAAAPLRAPVALSLVSDGALVLLALGPLVLALCASALGLVELRAAGEGPQRYVQALESLQEVLAPLRPGFTSSALLSAGVALLWSIRSWLLRPEAREARAVAAFLRAAEASGRTLVAPTSARLASAMAPRADVGLAIIAAAVFMLSAALAFGVLGFATEIRRANSASLSFQWPKDAVATTDVTVAMPAGAAGTPLPKGPTLVASLVGVELNAIRIIELEDGEIPGDFKGNAIKVAEVAESFRDGGAHPPIRVLAHRALRAKTVIQILEYLREEYGADRFAPIVERHLSDHAQPTHAAFHLSLSTTDGPLAAKLHVDTDTVSITFGGGVVQRVALSDRSWASALRTSVQGSSGVRDGSGRAPLKLATAIDLGEEVTWGMLLQVLAAADGVCPSTDDCGLPGVGLSFQVAKNPQPE